MGCGNPRPNIANTIRLIDDRCFDSQQHPNPADRELARSDGTPIHVWENSLLQKLSNSRPRKGFIVVMIAFIASVMCAQAGSSRLLFAMGRDGALPSLFAHLGRFRTPDFNVVLTGAVMLIGIVVDVDTAASCVNFGAFTAFAAVNFCVIYDHLGGRRVLPGGSVKLLLAGAGAGAAIWLLRSLQWTAVVVGLIWLTVGCAWLLLRTQRSRARAR